MQDSSQIYECISTYASTGKRPLCKRGIPYAVFSTACGTTKRATPLVNCQHGTEILLDARNTSREQLPEWTAASVAEVLGSQIKPCKWKASGPQRQKQPNTIQSVHFTCRRHGKGKEAMQHDHIEAAYAEQTTVHLHWRIDDDNDDDLSVQLLRWSVKPRRSHTAPCLPRRSHTAPCKRRRVASNSRAVAAAAYARPVPDQQAENLARCIEAGDDLVDHAGTFDSALANVVVPFSIQPGSFTMLSFAAKHRRTNIVRALLAGGALPDGTRENGAAALHEAAYRGDTAIVRLLLEAGADPCAATRGGWW